MRVSLEKVREQFLVSELRYINARSTDMSH